MKKITLLFYGIFLFIGISNGQCPVDTFSRLGVICADNPISITNLSSGASSYQWDFCGGDFSTPYVYAVDDTPSADSHSSMNLVNDGANWYGFLFNYNSSTITRYDYGSSLDNNPSRIDLGNLNGAIPGGGGFFNDMSFIKEGSNWYGIFFVYLTGDLVLVSFGPNLSNDTPATSINNSIHQSAVAYQDLKVDNGNIYLFVARDNGGEIIRLNYGNSITNTPAADYLFLPSYSELGDISLVKYCNQWYGFVASYSTYSIIRLDFGIALSDTPTITDLGNPGGVLVAKPWTIEMAYDGDQWYAFETGYNADINQINFGKDLTNTSPTGTSLNYPGISGIGTSVKVVKANSAFYLFLCSRNSNSFSKVKYESPCPINPQISAQINPVVTYTAGGTFIISLAASDSAGDISYYSDSVQVKYSPTANFSFQNICFNDSTVFQDSSYFSQGTITSRLWNFGDSTTSTASNPKHKFSSPGSYIVSLTLNGSLGCNSIHTDTVVIGDIPVTNFSANGGCTNVPVSFFDSSTVNYNNTINKWHWDFGNNDTSDVQNPVYQYAIGGTYTVTLTVSTNYNCVASPHQINITVKDAPKAGFNIANTCKGDTVKFADASTISNGSINSWKWNFGDADTSALQNPTHPYIDSVLTYNVSLVVIASDGCSDTSSLAIKINNVPRDSFSVAPATLCEGNSVTLTDHSTVTGDTIYAWHWDFGDGDTSLLKNPSHAYLSFGSYNIVLTVYSQTSCSSSSFQMVTVVKSPTAGFTYSSVCLHDSTHFTDISNPSLGTTLTAWHWDFGDGDTSNLINPVHLFDSAGTHLVTLRVTDNIGCSNIFEDSVIVHHLPVANFTGTAGCSNVPNAFVNTSTSSDDTINTYSWNFGDPPSGNKNTSASPGPSHIYNSPGTYNVTLVVITAFGCSDTVTKSTVIKQSSLADFNYLPTCAQNQMIFTNHDSQPLDDISWLWSFGDLQLSYIASPSHYYLNPGPYTVTLTVTAKGGCVTSISKNVIVNPNPVADFVTAPGCINAPYFFQDASYVTAGKIEKWHWTFGNGDSSDMQFPQATYTDTGDYVVTLRVVSDTLSGCTHDTIKVIHVYPLPTANFTYNPLFGSAPLLVTFNDNSANAAVYSWNFGDGSALNDSASPHHTYLDTGKFSITQVVYSAQGCTDSITKVFYVIKPRLDISVTSVSYRVTNNLFKISAQVANLGTRDIDNYFMQASIQDGSTIEEFVNDPLPSGSPVITYNFTAGFEISSEQKVNYYCVSALSPDGETDDNPANNEKCATISRDLTVVQPFPNPFSDQLQIKFIMPYRDQITIELFDMVGQLISTLYDGGAPAGANTLDINTGELESEVYFCRFTFRDQTIIYPVVKSQNK